MLSLIPLFPFVGFLVNASLGRRLTKSISGGLACAAMIASFAVSAMLVGRILGHDAAPLEFTAFEWITSGTLHVPFTLRLDHLSAVMILVITGIGSLIHIYSTGYMHDESDSEYARYFSYLNLFASFMLVLVLGGNFPVMFVGWEGVGLCSYLLIGFWFRKQSAADAGKKAFIVNRIGDVGFVLGVLLIFVRFGTLDFQEIGRSLAALAPETAFGTISVITLLLFIGATGKSAQIPLFVWLPDAMEGPTPVSALIHAATMVAAGVYLVGRIFPVLTPDAKLFVAIIGCVTLTMAALIAIAQSDIKKVLAYSTLSQLGYMILAMGIGSWVGGLFHLITHAFFKALLFLGSGSVIHAAHHEQELPQYGGLIRKIPVTGITFAIAVLAISGTPLFSGHYSKDMILAHAGAFASLAADEGRSKWYWAFFILPTVIAYVTAFYMMRCWMLTFWGKPRNQHLYDHAHEAPIMWVPLAVLAIFSVIGWISVPELLEGSVRESGSYVQWLADRDTTGAYKGKTVAGFATAWPIKLGEGAAEAGPASAVTPFTPSQEAHERGENLTKRFVTWAFVIGIGAGFFIYLRGYAVAHVLVRIPPLGWIHKWLYDRMYFDELYFFCFVSVTMALAAISGWFDRYVVDGIVNGVARLVKQSAFGVGANDRYVVDGAVNGLGHLAHGVGSAVRNPQSGRVRLYVTMLMLAVALGVAGAVIAVLSR
jgi:NADH-quinone oxidoreductase subunit L